MRSYYLLPVLVLALLTTNSDASRFRSPGPTSPRSEKKPVDWPGHYECEQCQAVAPATASGSDSPPAVKAECWKYSISILKYDSERRGQIVLSGPGTDGGFKTTVTGTADLVEFHYLEWLDPPAKPTPAPFKTDDVILSMQHREDDYILRFKKLPSKVAGQTAITCKRDT